MTGSMALYSSSPPAIWSHHQTAPAPAAAAVSSSFEVASGDGSYFQFYRGGGGGGVPQGAGGPSSVKPALGGLSSLFSSTSHCRPPIHPASDSGDGPCPVAVAATVGMIRSHSHNDVPSSLRECPSSDSSSGNSINIPLSKLREGSPSSSYAGSAGRSSFSLSTPNHFAHRHSMSSSRTRQEGFTVLTRAQSWSSFTCTEPSTDDNSSSDSSDSSPLHSFGLPQLTASSSPFLAEALSSPNPSSIFPWGSAHPSSHYCLAGPTQMPKPPVSYSDTILRNARSRHSLFNDPIVVKAFKEAEKAHSGQLRATGDPYLLHCVETALILAEAGANGTTVAAGLLHDTLDDSLFNKGHLVECFGEDIAALVEGVSRLSELSQLARDNNTAYKSLEADRLQTMFLSMVDVRVVMIKLADRLHNMRTLGALPKPKQYRIASETLEIFAPLANRLGIWSWKAEMEDLCFMYLKEDEHQMLVDKLAKVSREQTLMLAIQKMDEALRKEGVIFHDLCGRSKSLYSIHSKMTRKGRRIDEIYDVRGLRLIVADESKCFTALEVVHKLWSHIPGKLKDYITTPKENGYRSLHTVVMGDDGLPLEVQIRTLDMHHRAEYGVAAHWRYKEGHDNYSRFISQRVEWARWVLTWHNEVVDSKLRLSPAGLDLRPPCPFPFHLDTCPHLTPRNCPPENADDPLFVIVLEEEKMAVQELPPGSTLADLCNELHQQYSSLSVNALPAGKDVMLEVNHKLAPHSQKLQMGDLIEFLPYLTSSGTLDDCRKRIRRMYGDVKAGCAMSIPS